MTPLVYKTLKTNINAYKMLRDVSGGAGARPGLAETRQGPFSQTTDCVTLPAGGQIHGTRVNQGGGASSTTGGGQILGDMEESGGIEEEVMGPPLLSRRHTGPAHRGGSTGGAGPPGGVITTSIDEGVELDSALCSSASLYQVKLFV